MNIKDTEVGNHQKTHLKLCELRSRDVIPIFFTQSLKRCQVTVYKLGVLLDAKFPWH